MKIRVIQTCDETSGYKGLMDVTREINELYCKKWGYEYVSYVGVKRGYHPWNATFNRIYLLEEILNAQDCDWVVYLDADCFVYDVNTRLEEIIFEEENQYRAFLFCRGSSDDLWDINCGSFFMNVKSSFSRPVITLWKTYFESILTDEILFRAKEPWSIASKTIMIQDQSMLEAVFKVYDVMGVLARFLRTYNGERGNRFNYSGPFIRQLIRPHMGVRGPCIDDRIADARIQVAEAFAKMNGVAPAPAAAPLAAHLPVPQPVTSACQPVRTATPVPVRYVEQPSDKPDVIQKSVTNAVIMNCSGFISDGIFPADDSF